MKPTRVFLNVSAVGPRRPAGADPFTYRETRPLRYRASWWTRSPGASELYRGKLVASREEAVRLARKWLAGQNKEKVHWIDTTDQSPRLGHAHEPSAPIEKKTAAQLDAEIAEALGKGE